MRAPPIIALAVALVFPMFTPSVQAQGFLLPNCGTDGACAVVPCLVDGPCRRPPTWNAAISRSASHVSVTLDNGVLHYEVDETFINRGGRIGEADYIFPLPKNAAFTDLKLSINGEMVGGETMDAQRARSTYEEIVRRLRDPALVEWMGYGMLRTRIFPILPGEEKRVVVRFDQVAEREGDALRIDYARGTAPALAQLARNTSSTDGPARSNFSFTLAYPASGAYGTPYSPTHDLVFDTHDGVRSVDALGNASEITLLLPLARASGAPAITLLANRDGRDDGFALINLMPPTAVRNSAPRDVTFVLDVSGSMTGAKLEQARAAGEQLLATLNRRDRFRLIDFSSDVRTFRDDFVEATPDNIRAGLAYLAALNAGGGTNISGALSEALAVKRDTEQSNNLGLVLFITDGQPTVGERNADSIAAQAARLRGATRVFTFGLGADVNTSLLEQLALQGRGTAQFVRPTEDVERAVSIVASRLTNPVATDVRVTADGVRLDRLLPSSPMDIFAGQNVVVLARYSGSGKATLHFDGNSANGPVHWTQRVDFPEREQDNSFIGRLWATQRIGYLSAERRRAGGSAELDEEIRSLGEKYGIPTEFTSFLVQEPGTNGAGLARAPRVIGSGRLELSAMVVTGAAVASAATSNKSFEAARQATAQRAATNLTAVDASVSSTTSGSSTGTTSRIGDRTFVLTNGVWKDSRLARSVGDSGNVIVRIQAFSPAYFSVLELVPSIKPMLALGDRVMVAGRGVVLEVGPTGATTLDPHDATALRSGWQ